MLTEGTLQETSAIIEQATEIPPIRILEIELGQPLPTFAAFDEKTNCHYQRAQCLVRLHDYPLGIVHLTFEQEKLSPADYVQEIWDTLHEPILAHLQRDGLSAVTEPGPEGVQALPCQQERVAFLATAPFVSIIVSTHNRTDQLSHCLPTLLAQCYARYEIIIVDNAPNTSTTANLIEQKYHRSEQLRYVREDIPGLSVGLNRGIAEARGEILVFTDDDVVVDRYWLLHLIRAFNLSHDVMCVTGLVLPQELETPAQIWFEEFNGFSKGFRQRIFDIAHPPAQEPLYPYTAGRFGTGANMAFRATFLKNIGGFDTALQVGMDMAAFFQVIKQGHKLVYEPTALVRHTHRRNYADLRKQLYSYGAALTAYLTKSMLDDPHLFFEIMAKVPYGLFFTLSKRSPKNARKSFSYPKSLTRVERVGMLSGPVIYLCRRRKRITFPLPVSMVSTQIQENGAS